MPLFTPSAVVPPPFVNPDYGNAFDLIGADGSEWSLCGGPLFIGAGASGFGLPEPEHRWSDLVGAHGSRWRGLRFGRREMTVPIEVDGRGLSPTAWRALETAFGRALDPRGVCALVVTSPDGTVQRTIDFRYASGGDDPVDLDPLRSGTSLYALECVAAEPFWRGVPVSVTVAPPSSPPSTVVNAGDVETWPVWTLTGPCVSATLNVAGLHVTLTAVGQLIDDQTTLTVDLNPGRTTVVDQDGNTMWANATTFVVDPAGIPVGTSPLSVSFSGALNGTTKARLDFETRYLRAWS